MLPIKRHPLPLDPVRLLFGRYAKIPAVHRSVTRLFQPKIDIYFERSRYIVKTIQTESELEEVLQLRYEIFHREFQKKIFPFGIDWETLDAIADHLVIVDKNENKIVGTYRVIASTFASRFYSESEFHLDKFLSQPGTKIELSRACIHKNYRNGAVMALLWRGISEYIKRVDAQFVFGCASVKTMSQKKTLEVLQRLAGRDLILRDYDIVPTLSYHMGLPADYPDVDLSKADPLPPLFEGYLRAGAKVCAVPALDREFKCVDFFTVLKISEMDKTFEKKYVNK